jgi:hypothetical protein
MLANKKTVYHSELVKAGPLWIMLEGKPQKSQYPNKPPYVKFVANDDFGTRSLHIESQGMCDYLATLPTGEWLEFTAEGSGDNALVFVRSRDGVSLGHNKAVPFAKGGAAPAAAPPPRATATTPPADVVPLPTRGKIAELETTAPAVELPAPRPSLAAEWVECYGGALFVRDAVRQRHGGAAADAIDPQSLATSLFIELQRSSGFREVYPREAAQPRRKAVSA